MNAFAWKDDLNLYAIGELFQKRFVDASSGKSSERQSHYASVESEEEQDGCVAPVRGQSLKTAVGGMLTCEGGSLSQ